ncbi:MAG TPA: hypothetical protein VEG63_01720 [Candidatus Acidoferrales bacterium]|nr:hypothetical protein [Candidatus Acidoferrales bacterium]
MQVTFSPMERELLLEILEEHHRELLREIARTDQRGFKVLLKNKEELVESMIQKLGAEIPSEPALQPL